MLLIYVVEFSSTIDYLEGPMIILILLQAFNILCKMYKTIRQVFVFDNVLFKHKLAFVLVNLSKLLYLLILKL